MESNNTQQQPAKPGRQHKKKLRKAAGWILTGIGIALAIFVVAVTLMVWILTPERLTPLIEKYGSEYLKADVRLDRAELTFWKSFPELQIDVDNLRLVSRSIDREKLSASTREQLPAYTDSLLAVDRIHGGVNALKLLVGRVALYDIEIARPRVNLVSVAPGISNYDIFPPSESKDTTEVKIPNISINRFAITGGAPIKYYSVADTLEVALNLQVVDLDGNENPRYRLDFDANTSAKIAPWIDLRRLPLEANGLIEWSPKTPLKVGLEDFRLGAGPVKTVVSTTIDASGDVLVIERLKGILEPLPVTDLLPYLPAEVKAETEGITTDMKITADVELLKPYRPTADAAPFARLTVEIPDSRIGYDGYTIDCFGMKADIDVDGNKIDRSVATLSKLTAVGDGAAFSLTGRATSLVSDPLIEGKFNGSVNFGRLPKKLLSLVPAIIKGNLRGEFGFKFRQSYLNQQGFHRILLNGEVALTGIDVIQSELGARLFTNHTDLKLGTSDSFVKNDMKNDSLLTMSVKADSLFVELPGMTLTTRNMLLGVGAKNISTSLDRDKINPIGAVFKVERLNFNSVADSMSVRLRDLMCRASLQRYEDKAKIPLLKFDLDARRMRYKDPLTHVNFRETRISATCHTRLKPRMSKRMELRFDSLQARYPHLRPDSVYSLLQAQMRQQRAARGHTRSSRDDGTETIDYGLDRTTKNWLRWVDFKGHLTAARARLFTPYFPVKNRLTDVNVTITPDSLTVRNTRYRMGQSDFLINGSISNITNALTSKRQTMKVRLRLSSDTINVNEIAEAAFAGAAFAEKMAGGMQINLGDSENDELMQQMVSHAASADEQAAIVIPVNIDAQLLMRAKNIIYSDICFKDFRGSALINDGALNLHKLSARTDMGAVDISALYSAPTRRDIDFAFGMDLKDLHIEDVMQLIPAVDTLMPLLRDIKGVINAEVAAQSKIDSLMNIEIPTLNAAIKISGDNLVLLDAETFRKIAKWLLFKNKKKNMVDHMEVQLVVSDNHLELFPFVFEIDRYRLGVMGSNDLALNYNYHVSVLKSPIPFKFGINLKGNPDKMKIRLGRAKFKENMVAERINIVDTTRINLLQQIESAFKRGVTTARMARMEIKKPDNSFQNDSEAADTISAADSLLFIQEGLLPAPPPSAEPATAPETDVKTKKAKKSKK